MRGRTNVLGFNEDFINANIIDAKVSDGENIASGNFVKFYNKSVGGYFIGREFEFLMELSDGRLLCAGDVSDSYKGRISILEKSGDGYVKNLPDFPFEAVGRATYTSAAYQARVPRSGRYIKIGDNEFCYLLLLLNKNTTSSYGSTSLVFRDFYFDVSNNELFTKDIVVGTNDVALNSEFDNYKYLISNGYVNLVVNNYKVGNIIYLVTGCNVTLSNAMNGSNQTTIGWLTFKKVTISGSSYSNRGFSISNNKLKRTTGIYNNLGTMEMLYTSKGIFTTYNRTNLYFSTIDGFGVDEPALISLNSANMYGAQSNNFVPLVLKDDYLYLLFTYSLIPYCAKIYFYDYGTEVKYLKYDSKIIFEKTYLVNTEYYTPFSFFELYNNNNGARLFLSIPVRDNSNTNLIDKNISFLLDIKETGGDAVANPYVEDEISSSYIYNNYIIGRVFKDVLFLSTTKFSIINMGKLINYNIVNDSELSASIESEYYVQNATNENYIMGVAKESGSSGDIISCYKAKTS